MVKKLLISSLRAGPMHISLVCVVLGKKFDFVFAAVSESKIVCWCLPSTGCDINDLVLGLSEHALVAAVEPKIVRKTHNFIAKKILLDGPSDTASSVPSTSNYAYDMGLNGEGMVRTQFTVIFSFVKTLTDRWGVRLWGRN